MNITLQSRGAFSGLFIKTMVCKNYTPCIDSLKSESEYASSAAVEDEPLHYSIASGQQ